MKINAFIFARGGSKGLPGKNIKLLNNKPLLQYSIETAKECPSISTIYVSTDDDGIASVAEENGATVIRRPAELASDTSAEWLAWRHAIEWVNEKVGEFDGFVSLPATSPLRSVEDVEKAIAKRVESKADVCISVTPASRSPYFNMVKFIDDDYVRLVNEAAGEVQRRQDAPSVYDITTVVYATTPAFVLNNYGLFSGKVTSIIVPKERAVDIDDIYDFYMAEILLRETANG
ncbi:MULTISPECIES: acylneuraminate cytidylyltransferase family protein [Citrobacter]|uniref:acylneuraminate cytidylyltransferase family protein n=1 Tax=Citrobacter TaxID=544 RepID=UPI0015EA1C15|nr:MULTISPECIES: acylneuraminate cytidylyltransferase family protein [Citrobacter]EHG7581696.1 acylneuraminate cytidylyltransferase family protein [Citrobacter sedlakii]EIQ7157114.1 acylneuraminate cytidylyltransferase family protein [Citrobacter sedlakii]MBN6599241.1 acylneuraminate cytidylyltransferase family protein [Citrobacter sedlakii]QMK45625.1 acylneuraminate cytidylyltransferase family protein [Citrobacter sp. RHB21-C05]QMK64069.1 acylneuraminate cytidylyltransferase family protein [C